MHQTTCESLVHDQWAQRPANIHDEQKLEGECPAPKRPSKLGSVAGLKSTCHLPLSVLRIVEAHKARGQVMIWWGTG